MASLLLVQGSSRAQDWEPLGGGFDWDVSALYGDTISDCLLVGGGFLHAINGPDSLLVMGMAKWDGAVWDSLATRIQVWPGVGAINCQNTHCFFRDEGKLYASGAWTFATSDSTYNRGLALLDESDQRWKALPCDNPVINGLYTLVPIPGDTLFVTGYQGSLCGQAQSCVYGFANGQLAPWEPFYAWPWNSQDYVGFVFKFQGLWYMTGLLNDDVNQTFYGMLRFNGSSWGTVPGFEVPAPIKRVLVHDNKLYIAGYFFEQQGAPGNCITMFDGTNWHNMGGGLVHSLTNPTSGNPYCWDMVFNGDDLYVGGQFEYAGGVPAQNVAKWDGTRWCSFGNTFDVPNPISVAIWRDDLYIAGGFGAINGVPINGIAHWTGGDNYAQCSEPQGIERSSATATIHVRGGNGLYEVSLPTTSAGPVEVFDVRGVRLASISLRGNASASLDLRVFAAGIYTVSCRLSNGTRAFARVTKE